MSIKIYNGLTLGDRELDIFEAANEVRAVVEKKFFDKAEALLGDDPDVDKFSKKIDELHQKRVHTLDERDIGYDVSFMQGKTHTLVLVFGEMSNEYTDDLISSGVCTPYGYWDNTDPPSDVSDNEWAKRRAEWGNALLVRGAQFNAMPDEVGLFIHHPNSYSLLMETLERRGK